MNKFILSGNLTADPTFTAGQEESKNRANFRIAYNHNKDKATFFGCTAWGRSAERVCKLKKGQRVLVEGDIEENEWAGQQGEKQRDKQVNVRNVEYIDFPVETQQQQSYAPQQQPPVGYQQSYGTPPYGVPPQQYGQPSTPGYGAPPATQAPQYNVPPQAPPQPQQQYAAPPAQPGYPPQPPQNYNYGQNAPF